MCIDVTVHNRCFSPLIVIMLQMFFISLNNDMINNLQCTRWLPERGYMKQITFFNFRNSNEINNVYLAFGSTGAILTISAKQHKIAKLNSNGAIL